MALPVTSFDELNRLVGFERSMSISKYFDDMHLTKQQKAHRKEMARKLYEEFVWLMSYMFYARQQGISVSMDALEEIRQRYRDVVGDTVVIDLYLSAHIDSITADIIDATNRHRDDPYFYSKDRARVIAENETSTTIDHSEYEDAVNGKRYKRWITIMDNHERESHAEANGMVMPIDEPFELQGGFLQYPHDGSLGCSEEELINCRCSCEYF